MKKIYDEIFELLGKHKNDVVFDVDELERQSKLHLYGLELKNKYGLNVNPKKIYNMDWQRFGDHRVITMYDGERRKISWSDDKRQPKNERLLLLKFPSGAYMFGSSMNDDYPVDLFKRFWEELKEFGPDYSDTSNKCLLFKLENASRVFNSFDSILKKYREINEKEYRQRQIYKLKKELAELEQ